ncbi:CPBP family intramembrane metalloprotease [Tenacibaculum sp. 190524A02b]|uniref:CPBP family intramembrane metalloprotease n=2 Tax=Tenacibaculum vairaonense TaxID=3137860 RepID=A0ABM9PHW1_9FLAO
MIFFDSKAMYIHSKYILQAFFATIVYQIVIELTAIWTLIIDFIGFDNYYKYYLLIQGFVQLVFIIGFFYFIKTGIANLFDKIDYKWSLISIVLGCLFPFIQTPLYWLYNSICQTNYSITYTLNNFDALLKINTMASILFIPIGEELFFRKYIQNKLYKNTNAVLLSIFISSFLFALIHTPYVSLIFGYQKANWLSPYITFFGGLISSYLYYQSKSVASSILFHIFWNLLVVIN